MLNYALLQAELGGMDKKHAVLRLTELHPHKSKSFFDRNYNHLMALDPRQLHETLGRSDPTANKAIRNVMKEMIPA